MKSCELNKLLIESIPDLHDNYIDEIEWQEGDDTGSHTVFGDVFTPYIVECIENQDKEKLRLIFNFLEKMLKIEDSYVDEVVSFSVIESIHEKLKKEKNLVDMMGKKTKKVFEDF